MAKIKVGFRGKKYTAKSEGRTKDDHYSMRIDSALKLLRYKPGWKYTKVKEFDGRVDGTRGLDYEGENYRELTAEDLDRIQEQVERYDYNATVIPSENKIEIWLPHLSTWRFVHPDLEATR